MHMVYTIALSRVQRTRQENRCTLRRKPLKAIKPGFASKWASVRSPAPRQHGLENTSEVSIMSMHTSVNHVSAPCREGKRQFDSYRVSPIQRTRLLQEGNSS